MARSKAPIIRGPIGQGAPFKQVYNSDGTPNYVMAVQQQAERSKASNMNHSQISDKSKSQQSIDKNEKGTASLKSKSADDYFPSRFAYLDQTSKNPTKDEPEIER